MPDPRHRRYVCVDTETTGLSLERHDIVELAWAVDDEQVIGGPIPHSLDGADSRALEINGYYRRRLHDATTWRTDLLEEFMEAAAGNILVGKNPAFDAARLERRAGYATWHHRLLDITGPAMFLLGFDQPPGLREIRDQLATLGFDLPAPDHSAAGDVETTRACMRALQRIATYLLMNGTPTAIEIQQWEAEQRS